MRGDRLPDKIKTVLDLPALRQAVSTLPTKPTKPGFTPNNKIDLNDKNAMRDSISRREQIPEEIV
jgi:hypothetical protein